jgi:eukaryotic-like serine/threonine-protein kinase
MIRAAMEHPSGPDRRDAAGAPVPPPEIDTGEEALKALANASDDVAMLKPGQVVGGQFEVVRLLGRGGMGLVYEVTDRITRQRLALKTIRPSLLQRPHLLESFVREVSIARQLRHPGIVAVYDVRRVGPLLFFTMEYLEGKTLRALMNERKVFTLRETVDILRPLAKALEHAHQYTVHRDLSPENIMVVDRGVKLLDFGIAKTLDRSPDARRTPGKLYYSAPEQRLHSPDVDARADIYPLGVIFLEMYTGHRPEKPLDSIRDCPGLPPLCARLALHSAVTLDRRFGTVTEFREALQACLGEANPPQTSSATTRKPARPRDEASPPPPGQAARPRRLAKAVRWTSLLLLLLAAAGSALLLGYLNRLWSLPHFGRITTPEAPPTAPPAPLPETEPVEQTAPNPYAWESDGTSATLRLPGNQRMAFGRVRLGVYTRGHQDDRMSDAGPPHQVSLSRGFWMGITEVTQGQWAAVMNTQPWRGHRDVLQDPAAPAVHVSWNDARAFLEKLNHGGAGVFRLPTEAEWEYACRAGSAQPFGDGGEDGLDDIAWYYGNTRSGGTRHARPVAMKQPNPWGFHDLRGNVAEWCTDWYSATAYAAYAQTVARDPEGPATGRMRVVRGGSWADFARNLASHSRGKEDPAKASAMIGFRVVREED